MSLLINGFKYIERQQDNNKIGDFFSSPFRIDFTVTKFHFFTCREMGKNNKTLITD